MSDPQHNWRRCAKCQGMWFAGIGVLGACPAGGGHSLVGSGSYVLFVDSPDVKGQRDWRWCMKCMGLWFSGSGTSGVCPAGGGHTLQASGQFALADGIVQLDPGGEAMVHQNWRWCHQCQGMFFALQPSHGRCPSGNGHSVVGSGHYNIWRTVERRLRKSEKEAFAYSFPKLQANQAVISAGKTGVYNCIGWSVGSADGWIWPGGDLAHFDAFYASRGLYRASSGPIVVLGRDAGDTRHAAVRGLGHGPHWESKLGQGPRMEHVLTQLEEGVYGNVVAYYAIRPRSHLDTPPEPPTTMSLTRRHREKIRKRARMGSRAARAEVERRHARWQRAITRSPRVWLSSDPAARRQVDEFYELVALGPEIIPFVIEQLSDPQNFFAVQVFEHLQPPARKKRPSARPVVLSEQQKAARIVERWLRET